MTEDEKHELREKIKQLSGKQRKKIAELAKQGGAEA